MFSFGQQNSIIIFLELFGVLFVLLAGQLLHCLLHKEGGYLIPYALGRFVLLLLFWLFPRFIG